jgi:glyoxylase-like metal-dependent hydrolase (beta-lactamase superfamily II)
MRFRCDLLRLLLTMVGIGLGVAATPMSAQSERKVTQLAEGVYVIEHRDVRDGIRSGNTTVIIGERQVFVVDSGFLPTTAQEDIAQIRQWTDKPVAFVLNTHFHNDHNFGNRAYMDAFPALTIIAHVETKKSMDMFGPGSASREEKTNASLQTMLDTGKGPDGQPLTAEDRTEVKTALDRRLKLTEEIKASRFQSATLTFDHDFTIDLGSREVQVKFMGRGNTAGDAVVYLPKEKIVMTGDLVSYPIPSTLDGYPSEWIQTMQGLSEMDANTIVPGHGPVMHDKTYLFLVHDLLKSAVDQVNAKLLQSGPGFFQKLEDVRAAVDLTSFRERFAGKDADLGARFDNMAANLVKITFEEASLR